MIKHKLAVVGFSYLAGLTIGSLFDYNVSFIVATALFLMAVIAVIFKGRLTALVPLVAFAGFIVSGIYDYTVLKPFSELGSEPYSIEGSVVSKTDIGNDTAIYILETEIKGINTKISFFSEDYDIETGDKVSFFGVLQTFSDNTAFAEKTYNLSKGVLLKAVKIKDFTYEKSSSRPLTFHVGKLNDYIKSKIINAFPNDYGALICSVFLGDKSYLSDDLSSAVLRSGISHYTAVSGLHLTLIVSFFIPLFSLLNLRYKRQIKFIFLLVFILFFVLFYNFTPSVLRSGIMLIIFYGGELFFRKWSSFNSVGAALFLILLFKPYACSDPGLLLSIAGCFAVGVVSPTVCSLMKSRRFRKQKEAFVAIICVNFITIPIAALYFQGFSLVSFAANIIIAPFMSVLLLSLLIYVLTGTAVSVFLAVSAMSSKIIIGIIKILSSFKYAYISLEYDFIPYWAFAALLLILAVYFKSGKLKKVANSIKASCFTLCVLIAMITVYNIPFSSYTLVRTFSDGSSGAVIVRYKNACTVVATDDSKSVREFICDYLDIDLLGDASVICLLNSSHNSVPLFSELPAHRFISYDTDKTFDINGVLRVEKTGSAAIISAADTVINISNAIDADGNADIQILYGKGKTNNLTANRIIYIDSGKTELSENEINAYYSKSQFYIKENQHEN